MRVGELNHVKSMGYQKNYLGSFLIYLILISRKAAKIMIFRLVQGLE